ncbi:acyltransferase-domain-containing protein [Ramaria rubella]|nr:acyltransferase-domain-containing protein [Ramaria rubella]
MSPTTEESIHTIPISSRPPCSLHQRLLGLTFGILFNTGCLMIHGFQLLFLIPLRLLIIPVPLPLLQRLHEAGVRWTKGCFARLLVFVCQWFSPTRMLVTFEGNNLREEDVVVRDTDGRVTKLNLPEKLVLIANHQIYADWLYLWCLTYRAGLHKDVLIVLKDSLKWIPMLGWGMQIYHFIFLARAWASDRLLLSDKLSRLATRAQLRSTPLALMIFPEGTLVSKDTRPISKKFAEKLGIDDMQHTLLPRSTGLLYCLRSLSPQTPDLHLLDVTIAYEGIPRNGYGQSYYTLRSIFFDGVAPPSIHIHLRLYDVRKDVPLGHLPSTQSPISPTATNSRNLIPPSPRIVSPDAPVFSAIDIIHSSNGRISRAQREKNIDPSPEEAELFELWLRQLWRDKDALIEQFLVTGTFAQEPGRNPASARTAPASSTEDLPSHASGVTEVPVELRSQWEIPNGFAGFAPILFWALWRRVF